MTTAGRVFMTTCVCLCGVSVLSAQPQSAPPGQARELKPGSIKWQAAQARQKGESTVEIINIGFPPAIGSFDVAADHATIARARLKVAMTDVKEDTITTWYKFQLLEILSPGPESDTSLADYSEAELPSDLLPLQSDEFLVEISQGEAHIDGVTVRVRDTTFSALEVSGEYLMFLRFDLAKHYAFFPFLGQGVFLVGDSGRVKSLPGIQRGFIADHLDRRFSGSVQSLRAHLRSRSP